MNKVITTAIILLILGFASYQFLKPTEPAAPDISEVVLSEPYAAAEPRDEQNSAVAGKDDGTTARQSATSEDGLAADSASSPALASFLSQHGDSIVLDTEVLEKFTVDQLREGIRNMGLEGARDRLAIETEYTIESKLKDIKDTRPDALRCANELCALLFSGFEEATVLSAVDDLSRDPEINAATIGGTLYRIEENGIYYGVMVLVLDRGQPLRVK